MSNSILMRINKEEKELLDEILKDNPNKFKSYAELLGFLLQEKSTSKAQKLIKTFLLEKKCTHFATQVRLGKYRTDLIGGRLTLGRKEQTEFGYLIENELHLVEIKKSEEEVIKGIGQLLLYRQLLQKTSWIDRLYLYLAVETDILTTELQELLKLHGVGLLLMEGAYITSKIEAREQTSFLLGKLKQTAKMECNNCSSEYMLKGIQCQRCGELLHLNIYDDLFKGTNVNITNQVRTILSNEHLLKRIFTNQEEVLNGISKEINLRNNSI